MESAWDRPKKTDWTVKGLIFFRDFAIFLVAVPARIARIGSKQGAGLPSGRLSTVCNRLIHEFH